MRRGRTSGLTHQGRLPQKVEIVENMILSTFNNSIGSLLLKRIWCPLCFYERPGALWLEILSLKDPWSRSCAGGHRSLSSVLLVCSWPWPLTFWRRKAEQFPKGSDYLWRGSMYDILINSIIGPHARTSCGLVRVIKVNLPHSPIWSYFEFSEPLGCRCRVKWVYCRFSQIDYIFHYLEAI